MKASSIVALGAILIAAAVAPLHATDGHRPVAIVAPTPERAALARHVARLMSENGSRVRFEVIAAATPCPEGSMFIIAMDQGCTGTGTEAPSRAPELLLRPFSAREDKRERFSLDLSRHEGAGRAIWAFGQGVTAAVPDDGRLAVVGDRTLLARNLRKSVIDHATTTQRRIVFNGDFQAGARDYRTVAAAVVATDPTDVAIAAFPAEAAILVRDLRALKPTLRIHGSYLLANPAFARQAGDAAEHVTVSLSAFTDVEAAGADRLAVIARLLEPIAALPPDTRAAARSDLLHLFIGAQLAQAAIATAGSAAPPYAIRQWLTALRMDTLLAPVVFDTKQATFSFTGVRAQWRNGELVRDDAALRSVDNPK